LINLQNYYSSKESERDIALFADHCIREGYRFSPANDQHHHLECLVFQLAGRRGCQGVGGAVGAMAAGRCAGDALQGYKGLVLVVRKRGKERIPALVTVEFGVSIQLTTELFRLRAPI
jgi:hypothetical protein